MTTTNELEGPSMTTTFDALWNAPMSTRGFLSLSDRSNTVEISGLKTGKTTVLGWNTVPGLGLVVTLHEEGGQHWARRGEQASHPASTYTVLVSETGPRTYKYVRLSSPVEATNAAGRTAQTAKFIAAEEA